MDSSKEVAQEIAKKLRIYEESVAQKQIARQLRIDELFVQQERHPSTVSS